MLCDKCGKREANVHIRQTVNGVTTEKNLCEVCAREEQGLMNAFSVNNISSFFDNDRISRFFDSLFETSLLKRGPRRRGNLISSVSERNVPEGISGERYQSEFMGGYDPYGDNIPLPEITITENLDDANGGGNYDLNIQLKKAIENEDYEKAAELRDKMRQKDKEESDAKSADENAGVKESAEEENRSSEEKKEEP